MRALVARRNDECDMCVGWGGWRGSSAVSDRVSRRDAAKGLGREGRDLTGACGCGQGRMLGVRGTLSMERDVG